MFRRHGFGESLVRPQFGVLGLILVLGVSVGCSSSSKPDAAACQEAIDNMFDLWVKDDPAASGNREKMDPLMEGFRKQCQEKWSVKKVRCLAAATSKAQADACH